MKSLAKAIQDGHVRVNDINENVFSNMLWMQEIPDPELILRISGAHSNYLLYQAAYSEIDFIDYL